MSKENTNIAPSAEELDSTSARWMTQRTNTLITALSAKRNCNGSEKHNQIGESTMSYQEIAIKPISAGDQSPVVEQAMKIMSNDDPVYWCVDSDEKPVFISGEIMHRLAPAQFPDGASGWHMLAVHTRNLSAIKK